MNEKSLEKNLANLDRELVALQTAHDIGLGNTIFWEYTGTGQTLYQNIVCFIKLKVKDGEPINVILDYYVDTAKVGTGNIIKSTTYNDRYILYAMSIDFTMKTFNWKLVSTSKVEYAQLSTAQEAIDWLGTY